MLRLSWWRLPSTHSKRNLLTKYEENTFATSPITSVTAKPSIPNVLAEPKVDVEILDFTLVGPVLTVRPYCHTDNYWQVYFDTNEAIVRTAREAGWPAPTPSQIIRQA
mgnify:CR=1 FL=1